MANKLDKIRTGTATEVDGLGQDWTTDSEATRAAEAAAAGGNDGEGPDAYMTYLQQEHRKYRVLTLVMAILGVSLLLIAVGLNTSGIISLNIYNIFMTFAYLFIILTVVFGFTRVRPFKKQMKTYAEEQKAKSGPDPDEREYEIVDGIKFEKHEFKDMDAFYKIFERKVRTELIPPTEEYHKLRKIWLTVFAIAGILCLGAIILYAVDPSKSIFTSIVLVVAIILVIIAFYIDRTRMKPLRDEWARKFHMSEFQMRDNM